MSDDVILKVRDVYRTYDIKGGLFKKASQLTAVKGVSLDVERGSTLAVVGDE